MNDAHAVQVAQTCQLAMQRIVYFSTHPPQAADDNFRTIDPAPAAPTSIPTEELRSFTCSLYVFLNSLSHVRWAGQLAADSAQCGQQGSHTEEVQAAAA